MLGRSALRLANVAYLIVLGRARVERPAEEELGDHASQAPDVDGLAEGQAEQYLWRSIVSRLEIGGLNGLGDVGGGAEVDDLHFVRAGVWDRRA